MDQNDLEMADNASSSAASTSSSSADVGPFPTYITYDTVQSLMQISHRPVFYPLEQVASTPVLASPIAPPRACPRVLHGVQRKGCTAAEFEPKPQPSTSLVPMQTMPLVTAPTAITIGVAPGVSHAHNSIYRRSANSLPNVVRKECRFCKNNNEAPEIYGSHLLRHPKTNELTCPVLRQHVCEVCNATGDDAHTRNYCPLLKDRDRLIDPIPARLKSTRRQSNGSFRQINRKYR